MFEMVIRSRSVVGGISDLMAAVEEASLDDLTAMRAAQRPGVVVTLSVLMTVLRLYSDRARPWSAADWRAEWEAQLGPETCRPMAALGELAFMQPAVGKDEKINKLKELKPIDLEGVDAFTGVAHVVKGHTRASEEEWLLAIMGGLFRANSNYNRSTYRAGSALVLPSDGSLSSEVRTLAEVMETNAVRGITARDHLPWMNTRPNKPRGVAALPLPLLDIERTVRLRDDGTAGYESTNALWADPKAGTVVDPYACSTVDGPWRPKSLGYRQQHCALAGGKPRKGAAVVTPPIILALDNGQPTVRLCLLVTATGKHLGYRETIVNLTPRVRQVFMLAGQGQTDAPRRVSERILTALSTGEEFLRNALLVAGWNKKDAAVTRDRLMARARQASVQWLLELLDKHVNDATLQETIHARVRDETVAAYQEATRLTSDQLAVARGDRYLTYRLKEKLPMQADENAAPNRSDDRPQLVRRCSAVLFDAARHLSPDDRAVLRASNPTELPMAGWAVLATVSTPTEMDDPAVREMWTMIVRTLGAVRPSSRPLGMVLSQLEYPELRLRQLITARGAVLRGICAEVLAWIVANDVDSVDLGALAALMLAALMLADIQEDIDTLEWIRRRIAFGYVGKAA